MKKCKQKVPEKKCKPKYPKYIFGGVRAGAEQQQEQEELS